MKLIILLSAFVAIALAQVDCNSYCGGQVQPSNCEPAWPLGFQGSQCGEFCRTQCASLGLLTCVNSRYLCCMTAAQFNTSQNCWPTYNWL